MMLKKSGILFGILLGWCGLSHGFGLGNPHDYFERENKSWRMVLDQGTTRVFERFDRGFLRYDGVNPDYVDYLGGEPLRVKRTRFYFEFTEKSGRWDSWAFRVMPGGTLAFDQSPYHPYLCGLGASWRAKLPLSNNEFMCVLVGSWDWQYGWRMIKHSNGSTVHRRRDETNWTEAAGNVLFSYLLTESVSLYGGYSYLRTKIYVELSSFKTNWRNRRRGGVVFGFSVKNEKNRAYGMGFRGGNENSILVSYGWGI